jgi:hypothetical protein
MLSKRSRRYPLPFLLSFLSFFLKKKFIILLLSFEPTYPARIAGLGADPFVVVHTQEVPRGVSKAAALFALAKQSKTLGAYKLARTAYEKLQKLKVLPSHGTMVKSSACAHR